MNLILNGCSSSGKSTLMDDIVNQSKDLFIRMGIDVLWGHLLPINYIMFNEKAHLGFYFERDNEGLVTRTGPIGKKITDSFISMINLLNTDGFNVISDDVILNVEDFEKYTRLDIENTYMIGVFCEKSECLRREKLRGDRHLGLVNGQYDLVHEFKDYYDFSIDNTVITDQATRIINFVLTNKPQGIKNFINRLNAF